MGTVSFSCDNIFPTGCIVFTGDLPSFIDSETFPCNGSLDQYLEAVSGVVEDILDDIDLTGLDPQCFTFDPATVTVKELHQEQIDKICDHDLRISDLEDILLNFDIGSQTVEIDLDCLSSLAEPCDTGENTYTLLSVIRTLKAEICRLRTKLDECISTDCSSNCTSGTSGVDGGAGQSGTSGTSGTSAASPATSGVSGTSGTSGTSGCVEG